METICSSGFRIHTSQLDTFNGSSEELLKANVEKLIKSIMAKRDEKGGPDGFLYLEASFMVEKP